jgi:hypothetical protein
VGSSGRCDDRAAPDIRPTASGAANVPSGGADLQAPH